MNGMPSPAQSSFSVPAVSSASCRDSMTQGPAIRNSGYSRPTLNPQSFTRVSAGSGGDRRLGLLRLVRDRRLDEGPEQRMPFARRRSELRVELATDKPGMRGQFHHLAQLLGLGEPGNAQPFFLQPAKVLVVRLVAMPVALVDDVLAVDPACLAARLEGRSLCPKTHGAAQVGLLGAALDAAVAVLPLGDEGDDRMRRVGVELGRIGPRKADHVAGEFDHGELHAKANAQVRHPVLARVLDGLHLAFDAAL